jgi:uncharacterized protein (TIGR03083 family)
MDTNSLGERPAEWRAALASAAAWFAEVTPYAVDRLDEPGLGEWTVRDLVGHTSRSLITIDEYLTDDAALEVDLPTAASYFAAVHDVDHAAVAERGRAAGAALGDDPVAFVAELVRRVPPRVAAAPDDARVRSPFGTMLVAEYAVTRTFELTVHTCDLLRALARPGRPPADAARSALRLLADVTAQGDRAADVLLALTGRTALPEGFTAL